MMKGRHTELGWQGKIRLPLRMGAVRAMGAILVIIYQPVSCMMLRYLLLAKVGLLILMVHPSSAAIISFDGGGDGTNWNDPLNWDCDCLPGADDDPRIVGDYDVIISGGSVIVADFIYLDMAAKLTIDVDAEVRCDQIFMDLNMEPEIVNNGLIKSNKITVRAGSFLNSVSGEIRMIDPKS